jgi:hypothetical protein
MDAWDQGYGMGHTWGDCVCDNPYPAGTPDHDDWADGYQVGRDSRSIMDNDGSDPDED